MSKRRNIKDVLVEKRIELSKVLIFDPLYKNMSAEAKLFYGYILDKISLSEYTTMKQLNKGKYTNFVDENGDIFCIITNVEVCEILNCANGKATKTIKELNDVNLIELDRKSKGAYRFYVNNIQVTDIHAEIKSRAKVNYTLYLNNCKANNLEVNKELQYFIDAEFDKTTKNEDEDSSENIGTNTYHENRDIHITENGTRISRKSGQNYPYSNYPESDTKNHNDSGSDLDNVVEGNLPFDMSAENVDEDKKTKFKEYSPQEMVIFNEKLTLHYQAYLPIDRIKRAISKIGGKYVTGQAYDYPALLNAELNKQAVKYDLERIKEFKKEDKVKEDYKPMGIPFYNWLEK